MPIAIRIEGAEIHPEHRDPVVHVPSRAMPNRREVLEALANLERILNHSGINCPQSLETLRTYILTR